MAVKRDESAQADSHRYWVLGVLVFAFIQNVIDRSILGVLLEPIRHEFSLVDWQLGVLGGLAFAVFYATLGIPIAIVADRTNRRNVLGVCALLWSTMTILCGAAGSFLWLLAFRIGTAVGVAGASPPSHSMISDYFPLDKRGTALSIFALGVPIGVTCGNLLGGWGNEFFGWRWAFVLAGGGGIVAGLLVLLTVREPQRGYADASPPLASEAAPHVTDVLKFLWQRTAFRHIALGAGLHAFVWYGGSTFNAPFLIRSHDMGTGEAGSYLATFALIGGIGTFLGGYLSDRLSQRFNDRRWYVWVPAFGCVLMVPFQFVAYLHPALTAVVPSFVVMVMLASLFFGPSFAMTQGLVTVRMRAVAASILLFVQTMIGLGLGPLVVGAISYLLEPGLGVDSLRWALVIVGLVNVWAGVHYLWAARTVRLDLAVTEALSREGSVAPAR
jgi:MFS family permease